MNELKAAERLAQAVENDSENQEPDLLRTYKRMAGGFDAGLEPVDTIMGRAAEKRGASNVASSVRRHWTLRAAMVGTSICLLAGIAIAGRPATPSGRTVIAKALAEIEREGDGVLYIKSVEEVAGYASVSETWSDYKNQRFRRLRREEDRLIEDDIQSDRALYQYAVEEKKVVITGLIDPGPSGLFREREDLAETLRKLLKLGRASMTAEEIDGQSTLRIEFDSGAVGAEPPAGTPLAKTVVNVDSENFLPLKVAVYNLGSDKGKAVSKKVYEQVRWVSPVSLPPDIFSQDPPSNTQRVYTGLMNLKMARAYKELKLYYLGGDYNGLPLDSITDQAQANIFSHEPPGPSDVRVVYYGEDSRELSPDAPRIKIRHSAVGSKNGVHPMLESSWRHIEQSSQSVRIDGRDVELVWWTEAGDPRRFAQATFVDGDTEVCVQAQDGFDRPWQDEPKAIVVQAVSEIEPLNRSSN